mgnify:CR=1 FL=1
MPFDVNTFRANLLNDGARPTLFEVILTFPPAIITPGLVGLTEAVAFKARATSLPGDSISSIPVNYFGREIKVQGNRSFPDWSITVINDEDFLIRNSFERWMSLMNSHATNIKTFLGPEYQTDATVLQYGKNSEVIKSYTFYGLFPTDVSAIDLDWGSTDQIEEFAVTFAYQYWESNSTIAADVNAAGIL